MLILVATLYHQELNNLIFKCSFTVLIFSNRDGEVTKVHQEKMVLRYVDILFILSILYKMIRRDTIYKNNKFCLLYIFLSFPKRELLIIVNSKTTTIQLSVVS